MKRNLISFFLFFLFFGVFVNSEYSQEQGLIIWEIEDDKNFNSELIKSSPFILIGTLDGKIYGLDAQTGENKWTLSTGLPLVTMYTKKSPTINEKPMPIFIPSIGSSNIFSIHPGKEKIQKLPVSAKELIELSPFYSDNILYIGNKETHVFSLDPFSGTLIQSFSTKSPEIFQSCPHESDPSFNSIFIGRIDYRIHAIDRATGIELWNLTTGEYLTSSFFSANYETNSDNLGDEESIILGNNVDGSIYRLDKKKNEKLWEFSPSSRAVTAFRVDRGEFVTKLEWAQAKSSNGSSSVYVGRINGNLFAIEDKLGFSLSSHLLLPSSKEEEDEICLKENQECPVGVFILEELISPLIPQHLVSNQSSASLDPTNLSPKISSTDQLYIISVNVTIFFSLLFIALLFNYLRSKSSLSKENSKKTMKNEDGSVQIGKLKVTQNVLGHGSSGTIVYEGYFEGRKVAVKRLLSAFYNVAQQEISLLLETDRHPNLVSYFCKEEDSEFIYLALTFCPMTLADLVDKKEILIKFEVLHDRVKIISSMMNDLAKGLAYLHSLNIVHRDLKPQNILCDDKLTVMISDMGLAKKLELDQSSFSGSSIGSGSVGWQAAEIVLLKQKSGEKKNIRVTKSVDVFSYGCVVFYILSQGQHPFGESFEREVNILKDKTDIHLIDQIPEGHHLVKHCIQFKQENRLLLPEVLSHPFFWNDYQRLSFLKDASDILEAEQPNTPIIEELESAASSVVGDDWGVHLHVSLINNLGRYRKYDFKSVRDLLRVIRNKAHHFRDLEPEIQNILGDLPSGYVKYFTTKFPKLIMHVYRVLSHHRREEQSLAIYFPSISRKKSKHSSSTTKNQKKPKKN